MLKPLLEETYEYIDAVETNDRDNMREELGDMLLQSVFQAQVCAVDAQDPFNIDEVCNRLVDKLITRHPHVFQSDDATDASAPAPENAQDTLKLWEAMKQKEKHRKSMLEGISHAQGALPRAAGRLISQMPFFCFFVFFANVFVKYCVFYIFIIKNIANLKKCTIKQDKEGVWL